MSALLLLPGFGAVLLRRSGWRGAVLHAALFLALQAALGWPFLLSHPSSYLARAFELTRVFEHRWSVNWAFLSPQLFVSPLFSAVLLLLHFLLLLLFASTRWGGIMNLLSGEHTFELVVGNDICVLVLSFSFSLFAPGARLPTSAAVATRIQLEALLVGVVCARTLHYQFYAM
jgi:alpha-1,3-mannosyltransferase